MRRSLVALATLALLLPGAALGRLADAPTPGALAGALVADGVPPALTGAVAIDLAGGKTIYATHQARPLRPASTEKLTVAFAALRELGPAFRIQTLVLGVGERQGATWVGDMVLKGFGDPSLHGDDLARLAGQIRALGITKVSGSVLGDESFFDRRRVAPGWKPSFAINESAPLSALIVDRAWLDGRTRAEPATAAATLFTRALAGAGVHVDGPPRRGRADESSVQLARVTSPTIGRLVAWMNTESDNFVAEMLLKQLGAQLGGSGTTAAGAAAVRAALASRGIPLAGVRIVDGSGLSRDDRLTPQALAALLVDALEDPAIAGPFRGSLAIAGRTGTLEDRMRGTAAYGVVRAKTGTTDLASALAGYAADGYAFAILMNGSPIAVSGARLAQDRFAALLAAGL